MRPLQGVRPGTLNDASAFEVQGLAGWVLSFVRGSRGQRVSQRRQLQLVETLSLGGRRQLMLVTCAGESFLVGGSFESVDTIVRLKAEATLGFAADGLDESCR
jgi:flagellar biogenesis protein FliO